MALGKMLKSDYKQLGRAVDEYKNGISVSKKDWDTATNVLGGREPNELLGNKDELMSLTRGQRQAIGAIVGVQERESRGLPEEFVNAYSAMKKDGSGTYRTSNTAMIGYSRQFSENSSDLAAAGRLAAAGVIGFSATAGAINLVRGE